MKLRLFACAFVFAAMPAFANDDVDGITLIHGHPIYHETVKEAGVTMGLSVTGDQPHTAPLAELCDELRDAAGLRSEVRDDLKLRALFVVPYKGMVVEGYYLPEDKNLQDYALIQGVKVDRQVLDGIIARAGIPPRVLDETDVEQEISCQVHEPLWSISWQDVKPIGNEEPEPVIERARERFMSIYPTVVDRAKAPDLASQTTKDVLVKNIR